MSSRDTAVDKALEDLVKRRAREACEYCHSSKI
jgi:hypothetical protein